MSLTMITKLRHLWKTESGIAAIEFALMLPVLLTLFLGGFEMSRYVLIHQKAEKVAYTVTDVTTQFDSVTNAELAQVLTAATQLMLPYTFGADGVVIITSVYQSGTVNPPVVKWRYTGGGTLARTSQIGSVNGYATLPQNLTLNDKDNVIVAEVYYRFRPVFASRVLATSDIYKTAVYKPRLGVLTTPPT